jgi:predicted AlkP superfamily phosphohydrolase/phosphomutase
MTIKLNSKVLVVGLDGGTFDIIGPLLSQGKLPNIEKMMLSGVHSKLQSTILPLSPTAWTSFSTGKNAGKHGVYDFSRRIPGKYDYTPTTSYDQRAQPIWDIIGRAGGRSIVVNVPLTYPPKKLDGFMITGFPTPTEGESYTYPSSLLPALKNRFGEIRIHKPKVLYRKGKEEELTKEMIEITRQQTEITKFLMRGIEWNFAISAYDAPDIVGHYFWAYLDPKHPKHDSKLAPRVHRIVEEVHIELDRAVGKLVEVAGPNALKFIISDHGFGSVYYGVYVNNWLLNQGYMRFKHSLRTKAKYWAFKRGFHTYNLLRIAKMLHLVNSIEAAYATRSFLLNALKSASLSFDDIDWRRTRVYSFGNLGQLYLNLKGREPEGVVEEGEVKQLVEELTAKLGDLRDPNNGKRMFDNVYSKHEIYSGNATGDAPDIVFFDEDMIYAAHRMFELGSNKLVSQHPLYSGNHKMDGIFFMSGPGVKILPGPPQRKPKLVDLAPTILHYLGLNLPDDIDGFALKEFFESTSDFYTRPVEYSKILGDEDAEHARIREIVSKKASSLMSRPL